MQSKPTSKVIQISTSGVENTRSTQTSMITTTLCEDGSVWQNRLGHEEWECILGSCKPTLPNIPTPGSWWRKIGDKEKAQVSGIYLSVDQGIDVSLVWENDDCEEESLEVFMKIFEPLEGIR